MANGLICALPPNLAERHLDVLVARSDEVRLYRIKRPVPIQWRAIFVQRYSARGRVFDVCRQGVKDRLDIVSVTNPQIESCSTHRHAALDRSIEREERRCSRLALHRADHAICAIR